MTIVDPHAGSMRTRRDSCIPHLVTPHDTNNLPKVAHGVSIGTAGDLEVVDVEGNTVVIPSNCLATGIQHVMEIKRIKAANTTASEIVAWLPIVNADTDLD